MTLSRALVAVALFVGAPAAAQTTVYSDDFEGRRPAWQAHGLWATDETPQNAPGGHAASGTKSLNFNNGRNYSGTSRGAAASPLITVNPGAALSVHLACNYETETTGTRWDTRTVLLKLDGAVVSRSQLSSSRRTPLAQRCSAMGLWHTHELELAVPAASNGQLQIELEFNSGDDYANNFAGWFVDDVRVVDTTAPQPTAFQSVSRAYENFQQYNVRVVVAADKTATVYQSSPTARYAPLNGRATDAEFSALTDALQRADLASVPANIPDPHVYIVAPTWFELEVVSASGSETVGGSLGVYGQWAAQLSPVMDALQAIQDRLLNGTQAGDDHGNTIADATHLDLDPNVPATSGKIDPAGDEDMFAVAQIVPMIAIFPPPRSVYTFETTVEGSMDTFIELYDGNGTLLASNDDSGQGLASRLSYNAVRGSALYCKVRHYSSTGIGAYTIRATSTPVPYVGVPGPGTDDHSDTAQGATPLDVNSGATLAGQIGAAGDLDMFQFSHAYPEPFPLPTYTFVVETTVVGAMDTVIELIAPDGTTVVASNDDGPGMGLASKVTFTAQAGTIGFVKVRHYSSSGTGGYTLKATATQTTP